jgi:transposase
MRVAPAVVLTIEQEAELTRRVRSTLTSVRLSQRAQIVLLAAQGMQNKEIAKQLGIGRVQVARWRERYLVAGLAGIERDLPRGAPPVKVDVEQLVELTTQSKPEAATHWSTRKMGAVLGVSASTVMRHWQEHDLKPHLVRGFKVSRDPKFVEKLEDIVGLYMSPPEHALVLCCSRRRCLSPDRESRRGTRRAGRSASPWEGPRTRMDRGRASGARRRRSPSAARY